MNTQLELFDTEQYNIIPRLANLRNSIRLGWSPYSIDSLKNAARIYHILCNTVWTQYEEIMKENDYEQSCDNSDD